MKKVLVLTAALLVVAGCNRPQPEPPRATGAPIPPAARAQPVAIQPRVLPQPPVTTQPSAKEDRGPEVRAYLSQLASIEADLQQAMQRLQRTTSGALSLSGGMADALLLATESMKNAWSAYSALKPPPEAQKLHGLYGAWIRAGYAALNGTQKVAERYEAGETVPLTHIAAGRELTRQADQWKAQAVAEAARLSREYR